MMIKKIVLFFLFLGIFLFPFSLYASSCSFTDGGDITGMIGNCIDDTTVVQVNDASVASGGGFKEVIIKWVKNIATMLALLAVLFFVVGSVQLVLSTGDEEKLKKGKDMMKWALIGFLAIVSAGSIISLLIHYFYYQG